MDSPQKYDIPESYVVVRKLTLEEITRLSVSPFYIGHKCGRCKKFAYYGPKCTTCSVSYHYDCAYLRKTCCGLEILPVLTDPKTSSCPKCQQTVQFGPQCSNCHLKFHSYCITPYEQCCQLNLCEPPPRKQCPKCKKDVNFGPKCPFCLVVYHSQCVDQQLACCGVKFIPDNECIYKCKKCCRRLGLGSPMCQYCGELYHKFCAAALTKGCCGRPLALELYFIPSFKYMVQYFNKFVKRKAEIKRLEEMVITHTHTLRSMIREVHKQKRPKTTKNISCQTNVLDAIEIVEVKGEIEEKELDISCSPPPPILEREMSVTPEPSSSSHRAESNTESDDTLKNLFDFLYNMVKKFPPNLQTQVKIDLFKTVTEAEMKLQCNMIDNGTQNNSTK